MIVPFSAVFVSAGAILIRDSKILLVQERTGPNSGTYGIPGGRTNFG
jgi:ADP-ribose pyrophosphatase YjhB (NUDIX family)